MERNGSSDESAGPVPGRLDLTGCVFHRDKSSNARAMRGTQGRATASRLLLWGFVVSRSSVACGRTCVCCLVVQSDRCEAVRCKDLDPSAPQHFIQNCPRRDGKWGSALTQHTRNPSLLRGFITLLLHITPYLSESAAALLCTSCDTLRQFSQFDLVDEFSWQIHDSLLLANLLKLQNCCTTLTPLQQSFQKDIVNQSSPAYPSAQVAYTTAVPEPGALQHLAQSLGKRGKGLRNPRDAARPTWRTVSCITPSFARCLLGLCDREPTGRGEIDSTGFIQREA